MRLFLLRDNVSGESDEEDDGNGDSGATTAGEKNGDEGGAQAGEPRTSYKPQSLIPCLWRLRGSGLR